MRTSHRRSERGSALLTSIILLGVLMVLGVAAISLSAQERRNAAAKASVDALQACANAAQAKIWAEMSQYGLASLAGSVSVTVANGGSMPLPGGLTGMPGHYDSQNLPALTLNDVTYTETTSNGTLGEQDCTNRACGGGTLGHTQRAFAHCIDSSGRQFEVEIAVKFAL